MNKEENKGKRLKLTNSYTWCIFFFLIVRINSFFQVMKTYRVKHSLNFFWSKKYINYQLNIFDP